MNHMDGYIGLLQYGADFSKISPSVYVASGEGCIELFIIVLTPPTPQELRKLAENIKYPYVKIFAPTIDACFISDIFNSFNKTKNKLYGNVGIEKNTKLIFPEDIQIPTSIGFLDNVEKESTWINVEDVSLTIRYIDSKNPYKTGCYDIVLSTDDNSKYFASYMDVAKLESFLLEYSDTMELHLPFSTTLYGGMTYLDVMEHVSAKDKKRIIAHSFTDYNFFKYIEETNGANLGKRVNL